MIRSCSSQCTILLAFFSFRGHWMTCLLTIKIASKSTRVYWPHAYRRWSRWLAKCLSCQSTRIRIPTATAPTAIATAVDTQTNGQRTGTTLTILTSWPATKTGVRLPIQQRTVPRLPTTGMVARRRFCPSKCHPLHTRKGLWWPLRLMYNR